MDPITTAIVTALAIPLAKGVLDDGYKALKDALVKKFSEKKDLVDAVNKLEAQPESKARQAVVQEEVENAKVNDDPEIVKLAQDLLKQIKTEEPATSKFKTEFQAEVKGAQIGDSNKQENKFS